MAEKNKKQSVDDLQNIFSKESLKRLLRTAGISRVMAEVFDEIPNMMIRYVLDFSRRAIIFCLNANRNTVKQQDVVHAFESCKVVVTLSGDMNSSYTSSCNKTKNTSKLAKTKIRKNIEFQQKTSSHLKVPKAPYAEILKQVRTVNGGKVIRFSKRARNTLQNTIEKLIIDTLVRAKEITQTMKGESSMLSSKAIRLSSKK